MFAHRTHTGTTYARTHRRVHVNIVIEFRLRYTALHSTVIRSHRRKWPQVINGIFPINVSFSKMYLNIYVMVCRTFWFVVLRFWWKSFVYGQTTIIHWCACRMDVVCTAKPHHCKLQRWRRWQRWRQWRRWRRWRQPKASQWKRVTRFVVDYSNSVRSVWLALPWTISLHSFKGTTNIEHQYSSKRNECVRNEILSDNTCARTHGHSYN